MSNPLYKHKALEGNAFRFTVWITIAVAIGGLVEMVPLFSLQQGGQPSSAEAQAAALVKPPRPEGPSAELTVPQAAEPALRIRTLGGFRVWRGAEELGERAWGREKARQLFHLLLDVASGRKRTWAEQWKLHNALVLFNPAPVT